MDDETTTDIEVIQGATYSMRISWADSTQTPTVPISLDGYYAHMQIRTKAGGVGVPLLNLSSMDPSPSLVIEPDNATGVIVLRIGALDTAKLKKSCFYDLFVIKVDDPSEATRLCSGAVTLSKSVTVNTS